MHFCLLTLLAAVPAAFAAPIEKRTLPNEWIVQVAADADIESVMAQISDAALLRKRSLGDEEDFAPGYNYSIGDTFKGFSAHAPEALLISLQESGVITAYEADAEFTLEQAGPVVSQVDAPWGLARLSSRQPGSATHRHRANPGRGTFVYVIDSGVNINHVDFGGRASHGAFFSTDNNADDSTGHGSHVAGSAAGSFYGVAKEASVINVKVTGASIGRSSDLIAGVNWTSQDVRRNNRIRNSVINMSIGSPTSAMLNNAVEALANTGVQVVVAAGNSQIDARQWSPANVANVCTVGASNRTDGRWFASNFGPRIDIWAPGADIISTGNRDSTHVYRTSGTSMAAPHVSGLMAYLISVEGERTGVNAWCPRIKELATRGVITNLRNGGTADLAYNGIDL